MTSHLKGGDVWILAHYSCVANLYPALSSISINFAGISLFGWLKTHPRSLFLLGICLSKMFYNWIFLILKAWQILYFEDEQILRLASNDNLALKNLWHFIICSCEVKTCQFLYDVFLRWIQLHLSDGIFFVYSCYSIIVIILIKSELYFDFWLKKMSTVWLIITKIGE